MSDIEYGIRRSKFVECYQGNATQAAIEAGYSSKTARQQGQRLLTNVDIAMSIKTRHTASMDPIIADRKARQTFWSTIMHDPSMKMSDRLKASELLAKTDGDFIPKHNSHPAADFAENLRKARLRVAANREKQRQSNLAPQS